MIDFETLRRYALEAGIVVTTDTPAQEENARKCFGKFAALIEGHLTYDSIHSCHPNCDKPACVAIRAAVLAEREKWAKVFQRRMERALSNFKEELDACVSLVKGEE